MGWTNVSSDISAVDDTLTLRLSIYCNGQWIQGDDYTFIDKMDSVFHISYGSSIENGVDIFSEEQKKICPNLNGYYLHKEIDSFCQEYQKQK